MDGPGVAQRVHGDFHQEGEWKSGKGPPGGETPELVEGIVAASSNLLKYLEGKVDSEAPEVQHFWNLRAKYEMGKKPDKPMPSVEELDRAVQSTTQLCKNAKAKAEQTADLLDKAKAAYEEAKEADKQSQAAWAEAAGKMQAAREEQQKATRVPMVPP